MKYFELIIIFPKNKNDQKLWLKSMGLSGDKVVTDFSRLCKEHFDKADLIIDKYFLDKVCVLYGALPKW